MAGHGARARRRLIARVISVDIELALVGLAAMLEPATLLSSVLALTVGDRPLRTGFWFYLGGLGATMCVGVIAALALGSAAAPHDGEPKTWVSIVTLIAGAAVLGYVVYLVIQIVRRQHDGGSRAHSEDQAASTEQRMNKVASAPALSIVAAGAVLANPGVFMLLAAKNISQLGAGTVQFVLDWLLFALVALLPLGLALVMLLARVRAMDTILAAAHGLVVRHAQAILAVILLGLGVALLRDGIAGLMG
jgi:hypothetical protein